jgi:hypothetical protein
MQNKKTPITAGLKEAKNIGASLSPFSQSSPKCCCLQFSIAGSKNTLCIAQNYHCVMKIKSLANFINIAC